MGGKDYNVDFKVEGFKATDLAPAKFWKIFKDEYVKHQVIFEKLYNATVDRLNDLWKKAHPHKEGDEINESEVSEYVRYMRNHMDTLALMTALNGSPDDYLVPGIYCPEDGVPRFCCRIKQYPDLLIWHTEKCE